MVVLVWLGSPFALATVLGAAWPRSWPRWFPLLGLGVVLAFGFVLYAYFSAPPDFAHDRRGCSDRGQSLGRWWEPASSSFSLLAVTSLGLSDSLSELWCASSPPVTRRRRLNYPHGCPQE